MALQRETELLLFVQMECTSRESAERSHPSFLAIIQIKEPWGWSCTDLTGYPSFIHLLSPAPPPPTNQNEAKQNTVDAEIIFLGGGGVHSPGLRIGLCRLITKERGFFS